MPLTVRFRLVAAFAVCHYGWQQSTTKRNYRGSNWALKSGRWLALVSKLILGRTQDSIDAKSAICASFVVNNNRLPETFSHPLRQTVSKDAPSGAFFV